MPDSEGHLNIDFQNKVFPALRAGNIIFNIQAWGNYQKNELYILIKISLVKLQKLI